jgi:hypothetical protein
MDESKRTKSDKKENKQRRVRAPLRRIGVLEEEALGKLFMVTDASALAVHAHTHVQAQDGLCARLLALYSAYELAKRRKLGPMVLHDFEDQIMVTAMLIDSNSSGCYRDRPLGRETVHACSGAARGI